MKRIMVILILLLTVYGLIQIQTGNTWDGNSAWNATTKYQLLTAIDDSLKARMQSTSYLDFMLTTADSIASNDSMDVEITFINPIGSKQVAFFHNLAGVAEKIDLRWIFKIPNQYALLDSIHWNCWTETIAGSSAATQSYGIIYVYRDSTETERKTAAVATSDTIRSSTARTKRQQGLVLNYVPGTEDIMVKLSVYGIADTTLMISRPRLFWTNR